MKEKNIFFDLNLFGTRRRRRWRRGACRAREGNKINETVIVFLFRFFVFSVHSLQTIFVFLAIRLRPVFSLWFEKHKHGRVGSCARDTFRYKISFEFPININIQTQTRHYVSPIGVFDLHNEKRLASQEEEATNRFTAGRIRNLRVDLLHFLKTIAQSGLRQLEEPHTTTKKRPRFSSVYSKSIPIQVCCCAYPTMVSSDLFKTCLNLPGRARCRMIRRL